MHINQPQLSQLNHIPSHISHRSHNPHNNHRPHMPTSLHTQTSPHTQTTVLSHQRQTARTNHIHQCCMVTDGMSSLSRSYSYFYTPRTTKLLGVYWFHSVRPSVCPSCLPCPLCNICSSGWILSILATNDHYRERVCRTQWPLTLTYVFKVIRPWLRKSCPLCSVYSSGWILFIFGTSDHYH